MLRTGTSVTKDRSGMIMAGLFDENRVRDNTEDWMGSNKKEQGKNKMFVLE